MPSLSFIRVNTEDRKGIKRFIEGSRICITGVGYT